MPTPQEFQVIIIWIPELLAVFGLPLDNSGRNAKMGGTASIALATLPQ